MGYTKIPYCIGEGSMVLSCNRMGPHPVPVKPDLPGAVIVICVFHAMADTIPC